MVNYYIFGILGLISIILGTFILSLKKQVDRKKVYPFLFLGGVFLFLYSIYIDDIIFMILQGTYTLVVAYNIFKIYSK